MKTPDNNILINNHLANIKSSLHDLISVGLRDIQHQVKMLDERINKNGVDMSDELRVYNDNLVRFEDWDRYPKNQPGENSCQDWKISWHPDMQCVCHDNEYLVNNNLHRAECLFESYVERYCYLSDDIHDKFAEFKDHLWEKEILVYEDEGSTDEDYLYFLFDLKMKDRFPLIPNGHYSLSDKKMMFESDNCYTPDTTKKNLLCVGIG